MKQLLLASFFVLLSFGLFAQATPISEIRVASAGVFFTTSLPVGTKIYQVDTKQIWVVITAIDATGGAKTITTEAAKLQEVVPITIGTNDNTNLKIRTSGNSEGSTPATQIINLQPATASVADGSGKAGLISGDDQRKLNGMSTGVGVYTNQQFEITAGNITDGFVQLTTAPKTGTLASVVVSYNGLELNVANGQYSIDAAGKITFVAAKLSLALYDSITVTYMK